MSALRVVEAITRGTRGNERFTGRRVFLVVNEAGKVLATRDDRVSAERAREAFKAVVGDAVDTIVVK